MYLNYKRNITKFIFLYAYVIKNIKNLYSQDKIVCKSLYKPVLVMVQIYSCFHKWYFTILLKKNAWCAWQGRNILEKATRVVFFFVLTTHVFFICRYFISWPRANNKYYTVIGLISRASIPQQYTSVHNKLCIFPSFYKKKLKLIKVSIYKDRTGRVAEESTERNQLFRRLFISLCFEFYN